MASVFLTNADNVLVLIVSSSIKGTGLLSHELEQVREASKGGRVLAYKPGSVQLFLLPSGGSLRSLPAVPPPCPFLFCGCSDSQYPAQPLMLWNMNPLFTLRVLPCVLKFECISFYYFMRIKMLLSLTLPPKVSLSVKTPPVCSGCKGAAFHLKSHDWWLGAGSLVSFLPSSRFPCLQDSLCW